MIFDVLEKCFNKWCPNIVNSSLQPYIIVKEISFSRQNSQIHCEIVVLAVDDWHQTFLHFLCNIEYP